MTRQKKLKRAIRARSRKTGESYTSARRNLLRARLRKVAGAEPQVPSNAPPSRRPSARRRGPSDASVIRKTGHGLDHWFAVLDTFDAPKKGHTASAAHLHEAHGVPGWHAQMITVAYERDRGLRAANQAATGTFQVSVSKALAAPVAEVVDALQAVDRRRAWLRDADSDLAQALDAAFGGPKGRRVTMKSPTYARTRFRWDRSIVEIRINAKPRGGSVIAADTMKLDRPEHVELRRAQWKAALEALKDYL